MNDIEITRGDTLRLTISIKDEENNDYQIQSGDKVVFTVKKNTNTKGILIQKELVSEKILISPEDTDALPYGNYVYDVQLTQANGDVTTIIKPSKFVVTEEVTFHEQ